MSNYVDESYFDFDENLIKITECEVYGKLPNPFVMEDGSIADTKEKWEKRRKEIYKSAVELQYGTQPPKPEFLEVETLYNKGAKESSSSYKITTGTREKPVSFIMKTFNAGENPKAVVIGGDRCFEYYYDKEYIKMFRENNIMFVAFDRTELAHDIKNEGRGQGALYKTYPDYTFGALGAWAWGYSRCVDALEKLGRLPKTVAFTGHSRGAKAALLAGVLDERADIVNPNATCAGGSSCYRMHIKAIAENGVEKESETLKSIYQNFPFWFGPDLGEYSDRPQDLPFDSHYLKAMVAPRILVDTEAASDIWGGVTCTYMTSIAAKEVFKMLGVEENLYWSFRKGYHFQRHEDIFMLINVINHVTDGKPINDYFFKTPFKKPEPIFDWKAPEAK